MPIDPRQAGAARARWRRARPCPDAARGPGARAPLPSECGHGARGMRARRSDLRRDGAPACLHVASTTARQEIEAHESGAALAPKVRLPAEAAAGADASQADAHGHGHAGLRIIAFSGRSIAPVQLVQIGRSAARLAALPAEPKAARHPTRACRSRTTSAYSDHRMTERWATRGGARSRLV